MLKLWKILYHLNLIASDLKLENRDWKKYFNMCLTRLLIGWKLSKEWLFLVWIETKMKFSSIATCKYCDTERKHKFNLGEVFDKNGKYTATIKFDIEHFCIKCVCQHFVYMNLNRWFRIEQNKKYFQEKSLKND